MISDEKGFSRKLKKELIRHGLSVLRAETIAKGFPDLLISYNGYGNFLIELKVASSDDIASHIKLFDPMQLYWIERLHQSYGFVWVIGGSMVIYRVEKNKSYYLVEEARLDSMTDLISWLSIYG